MTATIPMPHPPLKPQGQYTDLTWATAGFVQSVSAIVTQDAVTVI